MLRSRIDRLAFLLLAALLVISGLAFGWNAYRATQPNRLIVAAEKGDTAMVSTLLAQGIDPNVLQTIGKNTDTTPLQRAIAGGHLETVRLLLKKGAKSHIATLSLATERDDPSCLFALIEHQQATLAYSLQQAAQKGNTSAVKALFENGAKLASDDHDTVMLCDAAGSGNVDLVRLLIERGANLDTIGATNFTPLMRAATAGKTEMVRLLLAGGADARMKNSLGHDVSYYARLHKQVEVEQVLAHHRITKTPEQPVAIRRRAYKLYQQGDIETAVRLLQSLLAKDASDTTARALLANGLASEGKLEQAVVEYRQVVQQEPSNAPAHFSLGMSLEYLNRPAEALAVYREAVRLRPYYPNYRLMLARSLKQVGKIADSLAEYRRLVENSPYYSLGYIELGWELMEAGQVDEAAIICRKAAELRYNDPNAHANLGKALTLQGKFNAAIQECNLSLKMDSTFAEAHYNLGVIYKKTHQTAEAKREFQTFLQMAQDMPGQQELIADAKKHLQQPEGN